MLENKKISIIGLGYVGLPLAVEFAKKYAVVGFDINENRIAQLNTGEDVTKETSKTELTAVLKSAASNEVGLFLSYENNTLAESNVYVVTVPTPIDESKRPDLRPLLSASRMIGEVLKKGDIVIYESTTYPGCTEEDCVPVLEKFSGLKFNVDFFCGYSPERINPGDKVNTLTKIKKVTSGSTPEIAETVDQLYSSIIEAGTFKASSLKVAEASKAIENAQRDVNISFVNELSLIFDRLGIDTNEVLEAAGTKWNFLKYKPGLVGGHCIGVDPYYLAYKAEQAGYHPAVILSGRRVNDGMGAFVANKIIKLLIAKGIQIKNARILILGITFKENCPDIRNTKIVDIRKELLEFGCLVDIYDPWANTLEVEHEFGFSILSRVSEEDLAQYEGIILGVSHAEFAQLALQTSPSKVIYDVKGVLNPQRIDARL
jgi:UDP-N-acetyl-D-glucosamine/UDP-N-acetyl-D-galactosamine dehydrogenase